MDLPHGGFDLVIMNPPFTRSTGHEAEKIGVPAPAFAGFATRDEEQRLMSRRLKTIRKLCMAGHGNAGLASHFIDLAHAKLRQPGGVLALVLPASVLQGEAWSAARRLLDHHYGDITIVSIAATGPTDRAFSADTHNAEVLVVATRQSPGQPTNEDVLYVNLLRRPRSILEAVTTAWAIRRIPDNRQVGLISVGTGERVGCHIRSTLSSAGSAGLRDADVADAAKGLVQGRLRLPTQSDVVPLPLVELGELGDRGLYHMDVSGTETIGDGLPRGPFDIVDLRAGDVPTYPALWSHEADREKRMVVEPDSMGRVRQGCRERAAAAMQRTASRLHFNRDFRINSQPLAACMTPEPSIGGRAWPNFLCTDTRWQPLLVLWANTTLGLIAFWWIGTRQRQGRAELTISKLPSLTVLDPRGLTETQLDRANTIFEQFERRELMPANEAWRDEARHDLDGAVLIDLLEMPEDILEPLALLRRQWCAEPSVHGGKNTAP